MIANIGELTHVIARDHVKLFQEEFIPVAISFQPEPDPLLQFCWEEKQRADQKRWEQFERERAAKQAGLSKFQPDHPGHLRWINLTQEELAQLIWSKPTQELAREFGLSDVAIAKRCKRWGIPKPPRGFWAKVRSGKLPHPKGIPQPNKG